MRLKGGGGEKRGREGTWPMRLPPSLTGAKRPLERQASVFGIVVSAEAPLKRNDKEWSLKSLKR